MADYFGNLLIEQQTLPHQAVFFKQAVAEVRAAQQEHEIQDTIVVVERTGNYHLAPQRAFAQAGFETRVVHPFTTKHYRLPANPGNKTDANDLQAQHRAAVAGFGLCTRELASPYRDLQLRARHRRNLVENASAIGCRVREHLHLSMPGYSTLFDHLLDHRSAMAIARRCESPARVRELGHAGLTRYLREQMVRCQPRTVEKVLAWAAQAADDSIRDGRLHHALWTDLEELYQHFQRQIRSLEQTLAGDLVQTPYIRLLAIPGINVVSAAELAGELGPIQHYANANAITGRSGLYPSRYQSDQTDHSGPLVRQANRRLRCALMRIADNLACHCAYYRSHADVDRARGINARASRVKIAKKFSRLAFVCLSGEERLRHPAVRQPDCVLEKLREFHHVRHTPLDQLLRDLQTAVTQLSMPTCRHEATVVAELLRQNSNRKRDGISIGALLPAVLARLQARSPGHTETTATTPVESTDIRDRS